jgi:ribonuclease HI
VAGRKSASLTRTTETTRGFARPARIVTRGGTLPYVADSSHRRRAPRRKGGTLRDGERRQLALASRHGAVPSPPAPTRRHRVLCDGGSRGNPGPAAIAAVLLTPAGEVLDQHAAAIGRATAATAEYRALALGLELAAAHGIDALDVCSDSKLAIAGLQGHDPSEPGLAALAARVRSASERFSDVGWVWHPRAQNGAADGLVRGLLWP